MSQRLYERSSISPFILRCSRTSGKRATQSWEFSPVCNFRHCTKTAFLSSSAFSMTMAKGHIVPASKGASVSHAMSCRSSINTNFEAGVSVGSSGASADRNFAPLPFPRGLIDADRVVECRLLPSIVGCVLCLLGIQGKGESTLSLNNVLISLSDPCKRRLCSGGMPCPTLAGGQRSCKANEGELRLSHSSSSCPTLWAKERRRS